MSSGNERTPHVVSIHQPEFFPWLGFIDKMRQCDTFVLLDSVQYEKNYFQNRNKIRTAWGWAWITLPVLTKGLFGQTIDLVKIENGQAWGRKHLQSIKQSYQSAPFLDKYFGELESIYKCSWDLLADLNIAVIRWLADSFALKVKFIRSSELAVTGKKTELLLNICKTLKAHTYLSGVSGRDYLEESLFKQEGIAVRYQDFHHPEYRQCYKPFLPMMSVLDLLFNEGPEGLKLIQAANSQSASTK